MSSLQRILQACALSIIGLFGCSKPAAETKQPVPEQLPVVEAKPVQPTPTGRWGKLPIPCEILTIEGSKAFVISPEAADRNVSIPWVWYAPTMTSYPGKEEAWMFGKFLEKGIAVVGIDVGESYGGPAGRKLFTALYRELTTNRGFAGKPVLLGRSRGGLMTLAWAVENPEKVAAFAGIYPVINLASYPGVAKAAKAYELSSAELEARLADHNPLDRLAPLARAKVPLFAIHGDVDKVVPLEANSAEAKRRYEALGGGMELIVPQGQGHNMWTGFFESSELVEFVLRHARP